MKKIKVSSKYNNKKIIYVIEKEFPMLSSGAIYKALRKKDIRVNDVKISDNVLVNEGDEIKIYISDENFSKSEIIYEDGNIVIVNKPYEIEVTGENSLTQMLSKKLGYAVFPCHRLDRNTKGLVIFSKSKQIQDILFEKFKNHEIEKEYVATVIRKFPNRTWDFKSIFI